MSDPLSSDRPGLLVSLAIGVFAGAVSGGFGVGGGILIVPALAVAGRMAQRRAHGTSLAATAPLAAAGLAGYAFAGEVDWVVALFLLAGSVIGALLGTHLLHRLPHRVLRRGFSLLLLLTAARMFLGDPEGAGRAALELGTAAGLGGIGLFSGSVAGLMGVGGGIIMVPAQAILFSVPSALAKGTSLAVIVPTAIVGSVQNLRKGNADLKVAAAVGLAGVVSSYLASQVSIGLDDRTSGLLFAGLLTVAAFRLIMNDRRAAPHAEESKVGEIAE